MPQIMVEDLCKTFKVPVRQSGFFNSFRGFVRREYREIDALKGISFGLDEGMVDPGLGESIRKSLGAFHREVLLAAGDPEQIDQLVGLCSVRAAQ